MSEKNSWESIKSDIGTGIGTGLKVADTMAIVYIVYVLGMAALIGLGLWIFIGG
jgi:hypothetical protein